MVKSCIFEENVKRYFVLMQRLYRKRVDLYEKEFWYDQIECFLSVIKVFQLL